MEALQRTEDIPSPLHHLWIHRRGSEGNINIRTWTSVFNLSLCTTAKPMQASYSREIDKIEFVSHEKKITQTYRNDIVIFAISKKKS